MADGDHTRAADAGDEDAPRPVECGHRGLRHGREGHLVEIKRGAAGALHEFATFHRDEARAEALEAGHVLVAARLVDAALAAELGLDRLHGHAVGLDTAIAAALADELVDDDAALGVREFALAAAAALLRRTGLVIDEDAGALHPHQLLLHLLQRAAVVEAGVGRKRAARGIFVGLVGDHRDAFDTDGAHLLGDLLDGQAAVIALPARHGDGIVEQDLVGDVGLGRDRVPDGHQS